MAWPVGNTDLMIRGTKLGKALLEDVAQVVERGGDTRIPGDWTEMKMVMIRKPGKDHKKEWRAIVPANTNGKLAEKIMAQELQRHEELWHERAFAGKEGEVVGRDAQSVFNTVRRDHTFKLLRGHE